MRRKAETGFVNPHAIDETSSISRSKHLEQWRLLWKRWDSATTGLGDEDGEYTLRRHAWESPMFSGSLFTDKLEDICRAMLPIIEPIAQLPGSDPDIFHSALIRIETGMAAYPEWMNLEKVGCVVGMFTTQCILKWLWLTSDSAAHLIDRLNCLQASLHILHLNRQGALHFMDMLPENYQQSIFSAIQAHENDPAWENRLRQANSVWQEIYLELARKFDMDLYHENCIRLIPMDWMYGIPPLKKLVETCRWKEAENICHQIIGSRTKQENETVCWDIETVLLASSVKHCVSRGADDPISNILKELHNIAQKTGRVHCQQIIEFQQFTYRNPFDWNGVNRLVRKIGKLPLSDLLNAWKQHIVYAAIGYQPEISKLASDCWIHWLIDAGIDDAKGKEWFSEKMQAWLHCILNHFKTFVEQAQAFFVLTRDLAEITDIRNRCPRLVDIATASIIGDKAHHRCRREWLQKMNGAEHLPLVMECWVKHAPKMVPNPAIAVSADYKSHIQWLAVVQEINPTAFKKLLDQWRSEHGRRRRLWDAIESGIEM